MKIKKITNEEKTKLCPKIILNGWWWKKYFKHYKKLSKVTNDLFLHDWLNGGYELYEEMYKMMLDQTFLSIFPPIINSSKKI